MFRGVYKTPSPAPDQVATSKPRGSQATKIRGLLGPTSSSLALISLNWAWPQVVARRVRPWVEKTHPVYLKKARLLKGKQSSYTTIPMGMVHIYLTWRVDFYGKFWEIYHIWRLWEWLKVALIIMFVYFLGGYARGVGWVAIYTTGENDVWVSFAHCKPKKYGMLDLWIFDWLSTLRKHGEVTVTLFDIPE